MRVRYQYFRNVDKDHNRPWGGFLLLQKNRFNVLLVNISTVKMCKVEDIRQIEYENIGSSTFLKVILAISS